MATSMSKFSSLPTTTRKFVFFYKKIRSLFKRKGWSKDSKEPTFSITFSTINFGYDYVALGLVQKTYRLIGWKLVIMSYKTKENHDGYEFSFDLHKLK